jgi:ABC-type nickel/cobalt efflux system permease component RcnA/ABC-type uncharacterized transport system substrate-binding protein
MKYRWIAVLWTFLLAGQVQAHPHFFIDVKGEAQFEQDVLVAVTLFWRLDDMSATMVLSDCDDNWNDKIDPEEKESFGEHYLEDLGEANFSATWFLNDEEVEDSSFGRLEFVGFEQRGDPIELRLRCPLNLEIGPEQQKLSLRMAHPMYLVAYTFTDNWKPGHPGAQVRVSQEQVDIYLPARAQERSAQSPYADLQITDPPARSLGLRDRFFQIQKKVNRRMNEALLAARNQYTWWIVATLFPLALAYGMVHAAGPGHGKSLVIGYFLHRRARLVSAFKLALVITTLHSVGALVLAGVFHTLLADVKGIARIRMQGWLTFSVGIAVVGYGSWLVLRSLTRKSFQAEDSIEAASGKGMLGIGVLAGLIPCPFTVAVLLLAMTHQLVWPGLAAVMGIVTGTFLLLCIVGLITIQARSRVGRMGKDARPGKVVHKGLGAAGGVLILIAGALLALLYYPAYSR